MQRAAEALGEPLMSAYGPCGGMPALVAALKEKLAAENGLTGVRSAPLLTCAMCCQNSRSPADGGKRCAIRSSRCTPSAV